MHVWESVDSDWQGAVFHSESLSLTYDRTHDQIAGFVVWSGYYGKLPDGVGIGDAIRMIEYKGWMLDEDESGWVNKAFPGVIIQAESEDPMSGDEGKGAVCRIIVERIF